VREVFGRSSKSKDTKDVKLNFNFVSFEMIVNSLCIEISIVTSQCLRTYRPRKGHARPHEI
jgi:hypothetical protein